MGFAYGWGRASQQTSITSLRFPAACAASLPRARPSNRYDLHSSLNKTFAIVRNEHGPAIRCSLTAETTQLGFHGLDVGGQWLIQFPQSGGIRCFAMLSGQCWLSVEGVSDPVRLTAGGLPPATERATFLLRRTDTGKAPGGASRLHELLPWKWCRTA